MTNLIAAICVATNSFIMPTNAAIRPTWRNQSAWDITVTRGWDMMASSLHELWLQSGGRMSEINETVAVVTNVVKADNGKDGCPYWQGGCLVLGCKQEKPEPATERTETTTVVERRTLRFRWNGERRELTTERVMDRKVRRWMRREQWEEAK